MPQPAATPKSIRRWIRKVGPAEVEFLLAVRLADWGAGGRGKAEQARQGAAEVRQVWADMAGPAAATESRLAVDGREVMAALDLSPGPAIGQALTYLQELVDDNPASNVKETLLAALLAWRNVSRKAAGEL